MDHGPQHVGEGSRDHTQLILRSPHRACVRKRPTRAELMLEYPPLSIANEQMLPEALSLFIDRLEGGENL